MQTTEGPRHLNACPTTQPRLAGWPKIVPKPVTFTERERVKIKAVLEAHKAKLEADVKENGDGRFSNTLGCGNCGDTGATYHTLYELALAFGISTPMDVL